jgi:predicted phosphodiesterase
MWNTHLLHRSEQIGELLVASIASQGVDFVIHCGDLTHWGDIKSFSYAHDILTRFKVPVLFTLGNHDTGLAGTRRNLARMFSLDQELFYYVKYINNVRYIFLDSNYAHLASGDESEEMCWDSTHEYTGVGFSSAQIAWLQAELQRDRDTMTLVVAHHPIASKSEYPIISPRDIGAPQLRIGPVWQKLFPKYHKEILALLEAAPNVRAMFTGHWHINCITRVRNLYHVKTSSLIEYPFEYRIVDINHHYLTVSTQTLPSEDVCKESLVDEWQNTWIRGELFDRERRIYVDDELIKTRL